MRSSVDARLVHSRALHREPVHHPNVRGARRLTALLVLLVTGYVTGGGFQPPEPVPEKAESPGEAKEKEEAKEAPKARKPPPPHTLPEAIHVYWVKLHSDPCHTRPENEKKDEKNGESDKKPPENGAGKNGVNGGRKNGAGSEPEGKKSPPAEGEEEKKNGDNGGGKEEPKDTWFSAHAQATMDTQRHDGFPAPYSGARSLSPLPEWDTSVTGTLFLAARLWDCGHYSGDVVFDPELAGGSGFSGVNGLAGFTNGDITRVGVVEPTPYFARLYLRQVWGFGGEQEKVEDDVNQVAGTRDVDRLTLTAGKFAFTDVIDQNRYSHDPRTQMTNWSIMYNSAWDYPANVRGYSYGFAFELNHKYWALRYGVMAEPEFANSAPLDPHIGRAQGHAAEFEQRWGLEEGEKPGAVRLMAYLNHAHMGDYREALDQMPVDPDVTLTRAYRYKYGVGLNFEQRLALDLGLWGRLGWSDGHTETWAFTPVDRTAALGLLLKGTCWARPADEVGIAGAINGLAKDHRDYLAAGGLDFSIGDGRLHYRHESIFESYYRVAVTKGMYLTPDFQMIANPAYNHDRGPVAVWSLLAHIEY